MTQALTNETSERQGADAILQFQIEELEMGGESALEGFVTVNNDEMDGLAGPHIIFEGANVHVRSGSGATDDSGVLTGLGNLVVGYNEDASLPGEQPENRTGSHNLVVGSEHTYSSYGGFVAGLNNNVSGPSASVSGGGNNTASSQFSSVSGGRSNEASGELSAVSGGQSSEASGFAASVSGGLNNLASNFNSLG